MKLGFLVVTYNRIDKLIKVLKSYDEQLDNDDVVIIIDNGSDDKTNTSLQYWMENRVSVFKVLIYKIEKNIGATNGFKTGLVKAKELKLDWCFIGDDDAYLGENFVKNCKKIILNIKNDIGAVTSKVVYPNNEIQKFHRRYLKKGIFNIKEINSTVDDYKKDCFEINLFSFVGVCLRMSLIEKIGYPEDKYYIWYDDTEFSIRVNEECKILCFPQLITIHDCSNIGGNGLPSYKEYYGYRNHLSMLKKHYSKRYYIFFKFLLKLRCISNFKKCYKRVTIIKDSINDFEKGIGGPSEKYLPLTFSMEIKKKHNEN